MCDTFIISEMTKNDNFDDYIQNILTSSKQITEDKHFKF